MLDAAERRAKIKAVLRVSAGNFLEAYDFIVYGYYALYIAGAFFPAQSEFASLMLSLMTFGAGYLMRPLGAIVLGYYMDKHGRRSGLILSLTLMAIGTLSIAVTPTYAQIGMLAPVLVVAGRLLQGLSAGVQFGGVAVYLSEIATPGRRSFYCSWQAASQQAAVIASALLGVALTHIMRPEDMSAWGWRLPLLAGCLIIPVILWLRRSLEETTAFRTSERIEHIGHGLRLLAQNWQIVVVGLMLTAMMTTSFYLITAYTPTFGRQALNLGARDALEVTLYIGISNFLWLPIGGMLADRIGQRPILLAIPLLALLTAYPAMSWMVADPSFGKLLAVELLLSFYFGTYSAALIPYLTQIMPAKIRTSAYSLAYSTATAVFGGFTPAICTYLIETTHNKASPALWLSVAAGFSLVAAIAVPGARAARKHSEALQAE